MKNVNIKSEWIEIISGFAPEIRGSVWDAVINYCSFGKEPENLSDAARMAFLFIKREVDKARAQCERARERVAQKAEKPATVETQFTPEPPRTPKEPTKDDGKVDLVLTEMGPNPLKVKIILHDTLKYASGAGDYNRFQETPGPWVLARNLPKEKAELIRRRLTEARATAHLRP